MEGVFHQPLGRGHLIPLFETARAFYTKTTGTQCMKA
jgi:hypothetical protein